MARQRVIQPEMWIDDGFMAMSDKARLLWIGMINFADDEGRGYGSPKSLKAAIFPGDEISIARMEKLILEVASHVRVKFYEIDTQLYYQLEKWKDYQKISHPQPSKIPGLGKIPGTFTESSRNVSGSIPNHSGQLINELNNKSIKRDSVNVQGAETPQAPGPALMRAGALPSRATTREKLVAQIGDIVPREPA